MVDASVLAPALADDEEDGERARGRLRGERLVAPELIDLEVVSVLRKARSSGSLDERRAALALADLVDLDLERVGHHLLLGRVWELRASLTPYHGAYVALAEAMGVTLVTADGRLAKAAGPRCTVERLG